MESVTTVSTIVSTVVALPIENIDTDQIVPARFLKAIDRADMGRHLFADWRYSPDGSPRPDFVLNDPEAQNAQILVAGRNFGCGSSREHAPWALKAFGFRAIVSTEFADIFRNNALKNSLLPVTIDQAAYDELLRMHVEQPDMKLEIDLRSQTVRLPNGRESMFPIDVFARHCLLNGIDELGYLLEQEPLIAAYEAMHPGIVDTCAGHPHRNLLP